MNNKVVFFTGILALSSFSSFLIVRTFHLPCLIELFLFPLWFYYRRSVSLPFRDMMALVLFVLVGTFIGLTSPYFNLWEILQMSRCFFLGGLGFVLLKNNELFASKSKLLALTFGTVVGDLLDSYITMRTVLGAGTDVEYAIGVNIILSVLWPVLIIFYKPSKWLLAVFVVVPLLCFMSISRGISTFFFIAIVLSFLVKTVKNPSKIFASILFLSFAFWALSNLYKSSERVVEHFSRSMHHRLYTKMRSYGHNGADEGRIAPYFWVANHLDYYAFPRGFQGKKFILDRKEDLTPVKNVWDSSYLEVLYTFGFIPFLFILVIYLYKLYQMLIYYHRSDNPIFAVASVMFITLLVEHFFGYGLYRSPFTVFSNGALLGFIWRISAHPDSIYDMPDEQNIEDRIYE